MADVQVYHDVGTDDDDLAVAASAGLELLGYIIAETASSPAVAETQLINGVDGDGIKVTQVFNAASATHQFTYPVPIPCPLGITVERIAGETAVTLFYRDRGTAVT